MLLRVDTASNLALHEQIAAQVRAAIANGDPAPGDRLPPARELADGLDVNVHTVLRALQTLRDEGLLEVRRGRGTIVTANAADTAGVTRLVQQLVAEARRVALSDDDIRNLVEVNL